MLFDELELAQNAELPLHASEQDNSPLRHHYSIMKKLLLSLLFILILSIPAFADGGVPLWGLNTSVFFTISSIFAIPALLLYPHAWGEAIFFCLFTLIILLLVVLIETVIIRKFIVQYDFKKLFGIVFKSNLISTIIGIILLFLPTPLVWSKLNTLWGALLGPWGFWGTYSLFIYNFLCLPLSYAVEYYYAKRILYPDNSLTTIKKSFLYANIVTYSLPILIYGIACIVQFKNSIH